MKANENFLGSDGADGEVWSADSGEEQQMFDQQEQLNAVGKHHTKSHAQDSQPYIVVVTNTTTANFTSVEILNADVAQFNTNNQTTGAGTLVVSYGLPTITYQQFLAAIASGLVFQVGITRLIAIASSTTLAQGQIQETVTITTKDINGNQVSRPFIPIIDNYQYQNTQVDIRYDYLVNGLTSVNIANIYANMIVKFLLYPARKHNPFTGLKGANTTAYRNPALNPALHK